MLFGVPPDTREHSPRTSSHASDTSVSSRCCTTIEGPSAGSDDADWVAFG